ncbi:hypothetical protein BXY66_0188 [Shimia isoporae]|uniref:TraB family protein n=1 Tax=Shimia isoporae TaxID=647720 RepID=A0A4R1NJG5_9RHOB|nr:TraB/GumN family protein [Shimia isoporae]TCL08155.1 hypothetical protein BXY66_0188 [Shimia isoporae]
MRNFLAAFAFLFTATALHASCEGPDTFLSLPEETRTALRAEAAQVPYHQGIMWQVEKNGVASILVGTLHVSHPTHDRTLNALRALEFEPEQVLLELTTPAQTAFQSHLIENPGVYLIESGDSLIDLLGDTHWATVSAQLQQRGIPPFLAARYQPWFLGLTLAMPPCAMAEIAAGKKGLDHLIEQETTGKADMGSLDSTQGLLEVLASDSLEEQLRQLRWSLELDLMADTGNEMPAMMAMYAAEDIQLIWELGQHTTLSRAKDDATIMELAALLAEVEAQLIERRNLQWVERLIPELAETPSLVAVGALHLPGEAGLLRLLENAGYKVTRLQRP